MRSIKNRIIPFLLAVAILVSSATGITEATTTTEAIGNVIGATVSGNVLTLSVDNGSAPNDLLTLEICQGNILRVDYQPNSVEPSPDTPIIDPNLIWSEVDSTIDISGDPIVLQTDEMRIEISRTPCRMTVKKADGTTLFWEPASGGVFYDGIRFVRAEASNMYGIHGYDCFSDNGELLRNNNTDTASAGQQGDSGGPFMWSTSGYGVLIDSDGGYPYTNSTDRKMEFYYGGTPEEGRRYEKDDVEYYVILGDPKEILTGYSKITGTSPMMPKWSLGFSNFEWDIDEGELMEMVELYRAKNIPIDSYAFDYDWKCYGDDNYGEFTWNTDNFPSAATNDLVTKMEASGIRMIGITKPRIVTKLSDGSITVQGQDASDGGYYYPGHYEYTDYFLPVTVNGIDFYNKDARTWWWEHSKAAFDKGIVGWWNDETDKVSSNGAEYWFGNFTTMYISQAMYEGQREYTDDSTRVWQTARNYYSGTQRYSTSIWSGDVATQFYKGERVSWAAGLNEQKAALLSTINNGQPKWGSDGGGFNQNSGNIENPSPELYTRWLQFASMTPVFRVHGTEYQQRQPWYFGTTAEEVTKAAIQLRYHLIPYMYSYEREAYVTGLGLIRPLLFDYPTDQNVANYTDAWMFGDWLLVAPITEEGLSVKWIYLPEGTWIDYNRGTVYEGGRYIPYSLNSESWTDLPMFIKEGAIIPTQQVVDYVGQAAIDHVLVDVFPTSETTSFRYYDDDGESYDYEDEIYFSQIISTIRQANTTQISVGSTVGSYDAGLEYYYFAVHGQAATSVTGSGSLTYYSDYNALLAADGEGWTTGKDVYGTVTYVKANAGGTTASVYTLTGCGSVTADSQIYEAEYASLFGSSTTDMAEVNQNHSGYSGTGFVDKLEADGTGVTFYAKVTNAGDYTVSFRYANGDATAKTLSVYVNGTYVGPLEMASTGNWNTWADADMLLSLAAGNNIVTLKHASETGDTGYVNLDYCEVPFFPETITVEAESAALYGSAQTNQDHWYYSGSGFVDGMTSVGSNVEFEITVPQTGTYDAVIRYCNGTQAAQNLNLYVNNTYVSSIYFTSAGGNWNEWRDLSQSLSLVEGKNTIELRFDNGNTGNINLDWLSVKISNATSIEIPLLDNGGFERDTTLSSAWTEWHPDGQDVAYGVDSGSGTNPPESPVSGDQRAYFYAAAAYQQSIHQGVSVTNGTYTVRAWVKISNATPTIGRMEVTGYGGSAVYVNMPASSVGWKLVETTITVTTGYLDIGFYCSSPGGTTVHIDSVEIVCT